MNKKKGVKKNIAVVNGSNINILGKREPKYYGSEMWDNIKLNLIKIGEEYNCKLIFFQSNHEGDIVDFIQRNADKMESILINPAGFSKTGYSILDALKAFEKPYVEVHLSNIYAREEWHSHSIFMKDALGIIIGFKGFSYQLGLRAIIKYLG